MYKRSVILVLGVVIIASLIAVSFMAPRLNPQKKAGPGKIAVIYVEGLIIGGRGQATLLSEAGGTDSIIRQIHEARDDSSIKAVVLRINSPGGSVPATQEVGEELTKLRESGKIVVASMGDIAASGGYWLAAVCDKIYANHGTLTGSIGVYMPYSNWEELYKKSGCVRKRLRAAPIRIF
jgi:protease-4